MKTYIDRTALSLLNAFVPFKNLNSFQGHDDEITVP